MFNEGFVSTTGATQDRDLADDAVWLAGRGRHRRCPHEPEALGLAGAAHHPARPGSRPGSTTHGALVLLRDQDRSLWDRAAIAAGERLLERAAALHRPGPLPAPGRDRRLPRHRRRRGRRPTGCRSSLLYDVLLGHDPRPVVRLNRAVALAQVGPEPTPRWPTSTGSADRLDGYHLFHATRAELLPARPRRRGRARPTPAPWRSPATTPSAGCWPPGSTDARSTTGPDDRATSEEVADRPAPIHVCHVLRYLVQRSQAGRWQVSPGRRGRGAARRTRRPRGSRSRRA